MGVGCKGAMDSNADHGVEYSLLCAHTKRTARLLTTDGHGSTSKMRQFKPVAIQPGTLCGFRMCCGRFIPRGSI